MTPQRGAETVRTQSPISRPEASASPPGAKLLTTTVDVVGQTTPSPKDSPGCERTSLALTWLGLGLGLGLGLELGLGSGLELGIGLGLGLG